MPRAPKSCGRYGCPAKVVARTYCPAHEAEQQAVMSSRRGSTAQRGYDGRHQREGAAAKRAAIGHPCPRCGEPLLAGQPLDYGHTVARAIDPTARADRVEHAHCNRSAQHHS